MQVHAFAPDSSLGRSPQRPGSCSSRWLAPHLMALSLPESAAGAVAEQLGGQMQTLRDSGRLESNVALLRDLCGAQAGQVVLRAPGLLLADLGVWTNFLDAYGVPATSIVKVWALERAHVAHLHAHTYTLSHIHTFTLPLPPCHLIRNLQICSDAPELFIRAGVHTAGHAILFFKSHGYTNHDITKRIVGYYPTLLACDLEADINPVLRCLEASGCSGPDLRLLVWEFPRIFQKDYRRHIKKFQFLGM